jgi:hypothetical protein
VCSSDLSVVPLADSQPPSQQYLSVPQAKPQNSFDKDKQGKPQEKKFKKPQNKSK